LPGWIWWRFPKPSARRQHLIDIIEWDAPGDSDKAIQRNLELMSPRHREYLLSIPNEQTAVATGYKRTRHGKQVLELRFDGVAGCLRTPDGGSSRQVLVIKRNDEIVTRLLTIRETARLMGASESFTLPGAYNDGYRAMGDAVAAPVAKYLGKHLLSKLMEATYE
jgi:DNA (cytosine-5)-methyltransferase 1